MVASCDRVDTAAPHPRQNHGSPVAAVTSPPSPPNRITRALLLSFFTRTIFSFFGFEGVASAGVGVASDGGVAPEDDFLNKLLKNPLFLDFSAE